MTAEEIQRIEEDFTALLKVLPDDDYGRAVRSVVAGGITIDAKEFLLDQGRTADVKVHKVFMWVSNTRENISDILDGRGTIASYTQLPVQVWETTTEMYDYFNRHYQTAVKLYPSFGITKEDIAQLGSILVILASITSKLGTDEAPAIELLRHYYSHLSTSKYSIQWNAKSGTFSRELEGRSRGQVRAEIQAHLDKYGGDIRKISTDLASRLVSDIDKLYGLVKVWSEAGILA